MASNRHFGVMGYIYAGLCLTASILLIINSSNTVKLARVDGDSISGVSIIVLIGSLICLVFNAFLMLGMIMNRLEFVKYHLRFISTIYVLILLGLIIGCIGSVIGLKNTGIPDANVIGLLAFTTTLMGITLITCVTLQFSLIVWILNGVMRLITEDMMRLLVSEDANEMA
ncbi:uncharacterized protein LOC5572996 [Aedes aegypti]|uniref:Uncharacterized protein n=1 Tax=Aedes aegypti TaxID=7159 RepID=A0A1S4F085_AEDAE|nr:uncharacterized protein LOC5572996 [Aedes aegypti]